LASVLEAGWAAERDGPPWRKPPKLLAAGGWAWARQTLQNDAAARNDRAAIERGRKAAQRTAGHIRRVWEHSPPDGRAQRAAAILEALRGFTGRAAAAYGRTGETRGLADEAWALKRQIEEIERASRGDLKDALGALETRSRHLRWLGLGVFASTLLLAAGLVDMTIRRVIARPLAAAAAELAHERDLLRILLDNVPDCIYFKDVEGRYIRVNKAQAALMRVQDPEEARGHTGSDYFSPETAESLRQGEMEIVRTGLPMVSKMEYLAAPGAARWMMSTKVPVKDERGHVRCIVGISRDTTAWKEAVDALQDSEASLRLLFSVIPHAVLVYDAESLALLEFNVGAVCQYGYSADELRKMRLPDLFAAGDQGRLTGALARLGPDEPMHGVWQHRTKDNLVLDVEITSRLVEFHGRPAALMLVEDISERKRLEVELQQAQRLEAVGHLAAGIAHEINTPIQYVGDNIRFFQDAFCARQKVVGAYERLREAAESAGFAPELLANLRAVMEEADFEYVGAEIPNAAAQSLDGIERVAAIVRAMKEFAHPGRTEKAAADLNKALSNALIVARNEIKYVADTRTEFGELPPVVCRIGEINQVILNLLVNAAHAIGEVMKTTGKKGLITLRTWQAGQQAVVQISARMISVRCAHGQASETYR